MFLKLFGVRMHFRKVDGGGQADYWNNVIEIDSKECKTIKEILSMALHELWHCICYQEGLYKNYHYNRRPRTKAEIRKTKLETGEFDEKSLIENELISLAKADFGVDVQVFSESDSKIYDPKGKARHARPFKPAILIE